MASAACAHRPQWTKSAPAGYRYDFFVGQGSDTVLQGARAHAAADALTRVAQSRGVHIVSRDSLATRIHESSMGVRRTADLERSITTEAAGAIPGPLRFVEEWTKRRGREHDAWLLLRVPKREGSRPAPSMFSFAASSALLPGAGQLTKGERVKGAAFLTSTIASAALGFHFDRQMSIALRQQSPLKSQRRNNELADHANVMYTARNFTWIAASALWILNIADAATSQAKYLAVTPMSSGRMAIALELSLREPRAEERNSSPSPESRRSKWTH